MFTFVNIQCSSRNKTSVQQSTNPLVQDYWWLMILAIIKLIDDWLISWNRCRCPGLSESRKMSKTSRRPTTSRTTRWSPIYFYTRTKTRTASYHTKNLVVLSMRNYSKVCLVSVFVRTQDLLNFLIHPCFSRPLCRRQCASNRNSSAWGHLMLEQIV